MSESRSYVGAAYDYDTDKVLVWERDSSGRHLKEWKAEHYFFVPAEDGEFKGLDGRPLKRLDFTSASELQEAVRRHGWHERYESDIPPLFKCLMNNYYDLPVPVVHYALIDIEVDYKSSIGFAGPTNAYAPISAVTIYQSWTNQYLMFFVPPMVNGGRAQLTPQEIQGYIIELAERGDLRRGAVPEVTICSHELELLRLMVDAIQDADIISGWNSDFFDLPYIIERLKLQLPRLVPKLCFQGARPPKEKLVERFGSQEKTYTLYGRTHLDYLQLFDKFTFEGRESYSLGNILQEEIGLSKLHYEGTLEQLYHQDPRRYAAYNFRDIDGLVQLDQKFKFIQLVNQMAHENTCLFENILGTVRYVETGIANRAIRVHGMRVPDKRITTDSEKVEGAIVLNPKIGMHEWIGSVDINSLYPSVIRALNISPEMFRGQFLNGEDDWRGIMNGDEAEHVMRDDSGETFSATGAEWKALLREQQWAISAYGTVFDQSQGPGIVADTLTFWFAERKRLQAEKKKWGKEVKRLESLKIVVDDA
jgi:DNA polymerase elongation subunit (family B)